jgi:hypothetical protein
MVFIDFKPTPAKLRQFGFAGAAAALAVAAMAMSRHGSSSRPALIWGVIAVLLLGIAIVRPALLRYAFVGLSLITFPIGWVVSFLLTAIIYFGAITPIALYFRACKRDRLHLRNEPRESYWQTRAEPPPARQYFRQF